MAPLDLDRCLEVAVTVAKEAGQMIREALNKTKKITIKDGGSDLVTDTDQRVEKLIIGTIHHAFPDHKFIGEESVAAGAKCDLTDEPTWIIDPVDGTMNFVHGFPQVAVSIGLWVKQQPELGLVYQAATDEMYTARRGHGAYVNGRRIHTSGETDLSSSLLLWEIGNYTDDIKLVDCLVSNVATFVPRVHNMRSLGSAALDICTVASGAADGYYQFGIHCWDMAAGALIVREAGGVIMDTEGGPFNVMSRRLVCASSRSLALSIVKQLKQISLPHDSQAPVIFG